ncbi:MAG: DPP IV N-terminal domain-containing protein [Planctomycetes bacterium]|nr:DPP IV N-terminal domain-containing protein [Planctomycetota bacterium]
MNRTSHVLQLLFLFVLLPCVASGQGTKADYERADGLRDRSSGKVFKSKVKPNWFRKGKAFWYRNDLAGGAREFILVDATSGTRESAFDHERLANTLASVSRRQVTGTHLPIEALTFNERKKTVRFRAYGKMWSCSLDTYEVAPSQEGSESTGVASGSPGGDESVRQVSPDGRWLPFVRDHNVFVRDVTSKAEFSLTQDGTANHAYESKFFWSPNSSRLVALRTEQGGERHIHFVEAVPEDQLQPKLHAMPYLKPGDDIPLTKPYLFDIGAKQQIPINDELFPNPWRVSQMRWSADSNRFTFLYNERGHQVLRVIVVDGTTGEAGVLIDERSDTFVDYAYKTYYRSFDATNEIIWMSERNGWNHLYLCDSQSGHVKNAITSGDWVVRDVEHVDESQRRVWFRASGVFPEQDPYYIHYCRVNFDGSGFKVLTCGNGTHSIQMSPERKFFVDTYSRVDQPAITELRRTGNGKLVVELERADWTALLATRWKVPERFVAKGRDGITNIHGVIWRPTNFDAQKSYPIIENIYAGPHDAFVPKKFSSHYKSQELAELGFIVVKMDGMGTNWRSKAFHDVCWKNLGDSGFADRIAWIKAAAKKFPYMDLDRVGVYGGSAGGQSSTRAMLAHGDFYKVAVSDCGCHDNRMDKIWWNELWMGWPIGDHYGEQSNVTNAHKLTGKLFLVVGAMDRNVDPASTMQVVNALIDADKDFDLLVVPRGGHGIAESRYGTRRRRDYFVRHLLGVEPRNQP